MTNNSNGDINQQWKIINSSTGGLPNKNVDDRFITAPLIWRLTIVLDKVNEYLFSIQSEPYNC